MSLRERVERSRRFWISVADQERAIEKRMIASGAEPKEIESTLDAHYRAAFNGFFEALSSNGEKRNEATPSTEPAREIARLRQAEAVKRIR